MKRVNSRWKAVLFDLDGTLLDTRALVAASHLHTFRTVLGQEIAESEVMRDYGRPLRYTFARYAPPAKVDEMLRVYREYNVAHHDDMTTLFSGVREGLQSLKEKLPDMLLGLVTSKKRPVALQGLQLFKLSEFFDVTVCEEDTTEHKPEPEPLFYAARKLQLLAEETLYVGDSPYDMMCASAAGAGPVAVAWSSFNLEELRQLKPVFLVQSISELADILAE